MLGFTKRRATSNRTGLAYLQRCLVSTTAPHPSGSPLVLLQLPTLVPLDQCPVPPPHRLFPDPTHRSHLTDLHSPRCEKPVCGGASQPTMASTRERRCPLAPLVRTTHRQEMRQVWMGPSSAPETQDHPGVRCCWCRGEETSFADQETLESGV